MKEYDSTRKQNFSKLFGGAMSMGYDSTGIVYPCHIPLHLYIPIKSLLYPTLYPYYFPYLPMISESGHSGTLRGYSHRRAREKEEREMRAVCHERESVERDMVPVCKWKCTLSLNTAESGRAVLKTSHCSARNICFSYTTWCCSSTLPECNIKCRT